MHPIVRQLNKHSHDKFYSPLPPSFMRVSSAGSLFGIVSNTQTRGKASTSLFTALPPAPRTDLHAGREPRVVPVANVGTFESTTLITPTIGSYAKQGGLAKVPTLNNKGKIVPGRNAKFPALSPNSLLSIYNSSHRIHGLPTYIEQVSRSDLECPLLISNIHS